MFGKPFHAPVTSPTRRRARTPTVRASAAARRAGRVLPGSRRTGPSVFPAAPRRWCCVVVRILTVGGDGRGPRTPRGAGDRRPLAHVPTSGLSAAKPLPARVCTPWPLPRAPSGPFTFLRPWSLHARCGGHGVATTGRLRAWSRPSSAGIAGVEPSTVGLGGVVLKVRQGIQVLDIGGDGRLQRDGSVSGADSVEPLAVLLPVPGVGGGRPGAGPEIEPAAPRRAPSGGGGAHRDAQDATRCGAHRALSAPYGMMRA